MREGWQYVFFFLFTVQYAVLTALIAWHEVHTADGRPWQDTLIAIGQGIAPWSIPIAIDSVLATEVVVFLAEKYIIRRNLREREEGREEGRVEGRVEGREEGRVEGHEEGREEGQSVLQARWVAWDRRREAAAAAGEEFTEPRPSPDKENSETIAS